MFGTVGDAATFIATMGEMQISYANKDLFKIAHALNIAYNKGMLDGLSKADHSDLVAETELNLSDSRSHLKIIRHQPDAKGRFGMVRNVEKVRKENESVTQTAAVIPGKHYDVY